MGVGCEEDSSEATKGDERGDVDEASEDDRETPDATDEKDEERDADDGEPGTDSPGDVGATLGDMEVVDSDESVVRRYGSVRAGDDVTVDCCR